MTPVRSPRDADPRHSGKKPLHSGKISSGQPVDKLPEISYGRR